MGLFDFFKSKRKDVSNGSNVNSIKSPKNNIAQGAPVSKTKSPGPESKKTTPNRIYIPLKCPMCGRLLQGPIVLAIRTAISMAEPCPSCDALITKEMMEPQLLKEEALNRENLQNKPEVTPHKNVIDISKVSKEGDVNTVKDYIQNGGDINTVDNCNRTPLIISSREGHTDIVKLLINAGANLNASDRESPSAGMSGNTALLWAAQKGHYEIVKLLIEAGADTDKRDNTGSTALGWAVYEGHNDVVQLLRKVGAKEYCRFSR